MDNKKLSQFYSLVNLLSLLTVVLCLEGCTPKVKAINSPATDRSESAAVYEVKNNNIKNDSAINQCNRDLESLRTVNATEYRRYLSEYDGLMKSSADFLTVKDDVSPEVAELARPRFQFALVNLCYRIKDTLARTFIRQAGGRE